MVGYLILSWLSTRRGVIVLLLLILIAASANLYRYVELKNHPPGKTVQAQHVMKLPLKKGGS
jgi:hypothetical protein